MDDLTRYRMRVIAVVAISLFAALVARLWYLQVITTEQAVAVAEQSVTRQIRVPAPRGRILDAQGRGPVSYKHLPAPETGRKLVWRPLL